MSTSRHRLALSWFGLKIRVLTSSSLQLKWWNLCVKPRICNINEYATFVYPKSWSKMICDFWQRALCSKVWWTSALRFKNIWQILHLAHCVRFPAPRWQSLSTLIVYHFLRALRRKYEKKFWFTPPRYYCKYQRRKTRSHHWLVTA